MITNTTNEFYKKIIQSSKWSKARTKYISEHPICERCQNALAEEVHHIIPLTRYNNDPEEMEIKAFDNENLMAVCRNCHYEIHQELGKNSKENLKNNQKKAVEYFIKNFL